MRFTVDVVPYHLLARTTAARAECVVLRRTVSTALPDASEVRVEELWASETAAHVHPLLAVARGIAGNARRLVLGEPVAVADMEPVTASVADALVALVDRAGAGVDRLVGFRGTVDVDAGTRTLEHGELLCPSAGVLARPVRSAFRHAIAELGCTADGSATPDDGPPGVADALRTDLRDARTRDDQQALWRSVAGAHLGPPVDVASFAAAADAGPVLAHWPRRTADGTTLLPPDGARPDLDSAAVTFVEGAVDEGLTLFRYRLDARIDLRAVLRQESVRAPFAAYAASGGTEPGLREAAVVALLGDTGRREPRIDAVGGTGSAAWLRGTVVVTDCRGVLVGNHLQHYNTVTATVAPTVGAAALLRDRPDLVESIVRYAGRVDGPPRTDVQRSLHVAVCGSAAEDATDVDLVDAVSRAVGLERPSPPEAARPATWTAYPLLAPPDPEWVGRVAEVVGRAVANGVPTGSLGAALCGAMAEPEAVDRALREVHPGAGTAAFRDALLGGTLVGQDRLTEVVAALEAEVGHATGRVVVEQDTTAGSARTTWLHPRAPHEHLVTGRPDRARVVLVRTAAGDHDTPVDVVVHELGGPQVPTALDGTVAVVESRTAQVGDHSYREHRIVASTSPTVRAAEMLAHDPDLVDALVDVASSHGGEAATARLREAVEHALPTTDGHGSVHHRPASGRTLQLRRAGPDRHVDRKTRGLA